MAARGSEVTSLRIKTITFRDYKDDGDQAMVETTFRELPTDVTDFENDLASIYATGGGDIPENGLEALHLAFCSKFNTNGMKDRQVIVLFTDADALPLKDPERVTNPIYPEDMVDEAGLIDEWIMASQEHAQKIKLNRKAKRLVVYAPKGSKYEAIASSLPGSNFVPVELSSGLVEFDFSDVIKIIAASASN